MVRTVLALLFALWLAPAHAQPVAGGQPIICDRVAATVALAAGTTQVVAGTTGQVINYCGVAWDENANGTVQLVFGTGATCTSPTNISVNWTILTNGSLVNHLSYAFASSAPGQSLCAVVTGTGNPVSIEAYYSQRP